MKKVILLAAATGLAVGGYVLSHRSPPAVEAPVIVAPEIVETARPLPETFVINDPAAVLLGEKKVPDKLLGR